MRRRSVLIGLGSAIVAGSVNAQEIRTPSGGVPTPSFWVDSGGGSDSNAGTLAAPFQTIAKLTTVLASRSYVWLKRGSSWREQFGTVGQTQTGVTIGAYGSGKMPILDAADVVTPANWSKTAGLTNVYDLTWTHDIASGSFLSLWESGTRLRWVASQVACDATEGSYFVATLDGTASSHVYYHPTGNGNPANNGLTVEMSKRSYGLITGNGWTVSDIHTRRQLHNDGSLVAGGGSVLFRCMAEDGTKHNLFLGGGLAEDCIAWKGDWADRTNSTAFVAFLGLGANNAALFRRCISKMDPAKVALANTGGQAIDGFYAHTGGSDKWAGIAYEDCSTYGASTGFNASNCSSLTITRPFTQETKQGTATGADNATITDPYVKDTAGSTVTMTSAFVSFGGNTTIQGLRAYGLVTTNAGDVYGGITTVSKSVIVRAPGQAGARFMVNGDSGGSVINSDHNILSGANGDMGLRLKGSGSADYNCYASDAMDFEVSTTYPTFTAYRAANPTLDVHSLAQDPLLNDPANGDFGVSLSSPAVALGAGLERPNITYTAIPSDAALAAM